MDVYGVQLPLNARKIGWGFAAFIAVTSSRAISFFMSDRGLSPMTLLSHVTALSYPATVADLIAVRLFLPRMLPARISWSHQSACSRKVVKGPVTSVKTSTESPPVAMICSRNLLSAIDALFDDGAFGPLVRDEILQLSLLPQPPPALVSVETSTDHPCRLIRVMFKIEHTVCISFLMLCGSNESGLKPCPLEPVTQPSLTNHENRRRYPCRKTTLQNRLSCALIVRNVAKRCSSELAWVQRQPEIKLNASTANIPWLLSCRVQSSAVRGRQIALLQPPALRGKLRTYTF